MGKVKYQIDQQAHDFLEKYINNTSPTGYEESGQRLWLEYIKPYTDTYQVDNYGTVTAIVNPEAEYKVVIEAHADEISWYVSYISDKGFLHVIRNGGSDHMIAPSMRVNIHTDQGMVDGVFGWPAIHLRKEKEHQPKISNITIDVGAASKEEVEAMGIHVGCVVTYKDEFFTLNGKYFGGRALDNRIGGFMIAEVARLIHTNQDKLPFGLYVVNAVQEEVGLRGAQMVVETIRPDMAIITDVCHDTSTPLIDAKEVGDTKCHLGPVVTYAPAVQNNVRKMIIDAAQQNEIPFQRDASSRVTGTDTDAFAYGSGGVPSALISLPTRYMHTTVELVSQSDVAETIKLIYATLLTVDPQKPLKYIQ